MRTALKSKLVIVVVGSFAIGTSVALAVTMASNHPTPERYAATSRLHIPSDLLGKTPTEKLDLITARLAGSAIDRAAIGGPPSGFKPTDGSVPTPEAFKVGKWAYFTVRAPEYSWRAIKPGWEAELASGALRDAMHADGETLYGTRVSFELPDGTILPNGTFGLGTGDIAYEQDFTSPGASKIEPTIRENASNAGLRIESVQLFTADQPAPAVVAETDDVAGFLSHIPERVSKLFGNPPQFEGYYLQVEDSSGSTVYAGAASFRTGSGHQWIRPDLDPAREHFGTEKIVPEGGNPG